MADNKIITKTFTYNLPDDYLHQTSNLKKTGTWTYTGPDKLWIFADSDTGKIRGGFHYTEKDNGADVPTPEGQIKILVDVEKDPIIASMIHNEVDYGKLPQHEEPLPNGLVYARPDPTPPDHTYELTEIVYDVKTQSFVQPFPWKKPHITWDELKQARDSILSSSDINVYMAQSNPELKAEWEEYRQTMRDLPTTFAGIDPWKVPFPPQPALPGSVR